jgi:SAM-dependent methyltransferase
MLRLPDNSCAYERYDPCTLEPTTSETALRLQELGWSAKDFCGKSVLDIGCNSGLLTMYALHLGAARVHACDVQPLLVDFVSEVVALRKVPVTVSKKAFNELQPAADKADVVFFMEVLHWVVSQGLELRDVIQRLAALTGELLYIEFPWSVREPSIQKQTKLTEELYSAEAVLDELTRCFRNVRVVRFMHYFGFKSQSVRVLIEARDKREEAEILQQLPDSYSLDRPLSRGRNQSYLLTSANGPLVAKSLARESSLARIPTELCNRLFDELASRQPQTLVLPNKIRGDYLLLTPDGRGWHAFPFVGAVLSLRKSKAPPTDPEFLINLFLKVRRDLRSLTPDTLTALRDHNLFPDLAETLRPDAKWLANPGELAPICSDLTKSLSGLRPLNPRCYDGLCHGDLQTGNFVVDRDGAVKVVDLDNLCVAPIYSDGLVGLIWRGFEPPVLSAFCEALAKEENRPVTRIDVLFAIAKSLVWFGAVRSVPRNPEIDAQIARLVSGLKGAVFYAASFPGDNRS